MDLIGSFRILNHFVFLSEGGWFSKHFGIFMKHSLWMKVGVEGQKNDIFVIQKILHRRSCHPGVFKGEVTRVSSVFLDHLMGPTKTPG